jgi:isopenicillin N synthase-like dioxygenase
LPYHQGEDDIMRFLLYTPVTPPESKDLKNPPIGAGAHSDYGTMTLLFQDSVGGLQVKSRDNTWIDAQVIPGTVL